MRRAAAAVMVVTLLAGVARPAAAQLAVTNLLETQNGNRPQNPFDPQPTNRIDLYDQLNVDYLFGPARIGARFELDQNSQDENPYDEFTQRYAEWSDERLRVRVGNFYTILGAGLLHRSFELPGVVLDDIGTHTRFAPSRDVDGVLAEGAAGPLSARLFGGRPSSGDRSPVTEELYDLPLHQGQLAGGQMALGGWRGARIGAAYLRASQNLGPGASRQDEFGSGFMEVDAFRIAGVEGVRAPVYVEYARQDATAGEWFDFDTGDDVPHALYAGANALWGTLTLSAEWKDYRDFRLGFNDPPSLVREHSWALLNRNTHVLNATDEEGYQLEGAWTLPGHGTVTLNRSRADGEFGLRSRRFDEYYAELHADPVGAWRWEPTAFYDTGKDEFQFVIDRDVYGGALTVVPLEPFSLAVDFETQFAQRVGEPSFDDQYLSVSIARAGWGSIGMVWERSTDPAQEDFDDLATPGVQPRTWLAGVLAARISDHHDATLFAGERRGGPACTAGTCYEVQPFVGVELRLISRF